jgi:hypothetical protein
MEAGALRYNFEDSRLEVRSLHHVHFCHTAAWHVTGARRDFGRRGTTVDSESQLSISGSKWFAG